MTSGRYLHVSQTIMALDPGNSTGWVMRTDSELIGGTIGSNHQDVWQLMNNLQPDILIYETFQMYPSKAQKLIWNTFYPCEVIGVIKLWAQLHPQVKLVGLQPSVKKFALSNSELDLWRSVKGTPITEHTRDAVRLLRYYERNG